MKQPPSLFGSPDGFRSNPDSNDPAPALLRADHYALKGVWRIRQPKQHAAAGATKSSVAGQPSYLYIFVHSTENRLKIGRSDTPLRRLAGLPEANHIDHIQSMRIELSDRQRAREVESMLHKALAGFRLTLVSLYASGLDKSSHLTPQAPAWAGATEWFSLSGMRHVMKLLQALPEFTAGLGFRLETLEGEPHALNSPQQSPRQANQRWDEASEYNLKRLDDIFDALLQISRHLKISWKDSGVSTNNPGISAVMTGGVLRVHGYKLWWDLGSLTSRMGITDHALWNLRQGRVSKSHRKCQRTGGPVAHATPVTSTTPTSPAPPASPITPPVSSPVISLVSLIRFASDQPNDLELVFNHPGLIRKVPAGVDINRRWAQFRKVIAA